MHPYHPNHLTMNVLTVHTLGKTESGLAWPTCWNRMLAALTPDRAAFTIQRELCSLECNDHKRMQLLHLTLNKTVYLHTGSSELVCQLFDDAEPALQLSVILDRHVPGTSGGRLAVQHVLCLLVCQLILRPAADSSTLLKTETGDYTIFATTAACTRL